MMSWKRERFSDNCARTSATSLAMKTGVEEVTSARQVPFLREGNPTSEPDRRISVIVTKMHFYEMLAVKESRILLHLYCYCVGVH